MAELQNPDILRAVLDSLQTAVGLLDRNGKILFWNQAAERLTGYIQHELLGRSGRDYVLTHCNDQDCGDCGEACPFTQVWHHGRPSRKRMQLRHKQGHAVPVFMHLAPIRDPHGAMIAVAASFDAHIARAQGDRDQRSPVPPGCIDESSGVASQGFTHFHLRERLAGFNEYHVPFSVICVRVDRLENFRTTYGCLATDAILHAMAQSLRYIVRPSDLLGRWNKNEFLLVLSNCGAIGGEKAFERVRRTATDASIRWWGDRLSLTTSMGYSSVEAGDTVDSLVARARRWLRLGEEAASGTLAAQHDTRS